MGQEAWPLWVGSELFACPTHPKPSVTPEQCHLGQSQLRNSGASET